MTRTFVSGTSTPAASVTVRWYGTSTAATIYADPTGSSISNPVTAAYDGAYSFWIDNGHYTVVNGTPTGNSELRIQSTNVGQQVPGTAPSDIKLDPFLASSTANVEALYEGLVAGTQTLGGASYTGAVTVTENGIGATSTDGLVLVNNTAAANAAQQWSPRLRFRGYGWETSGADTSMPVDWIIENVPVQSTLTEPSSKLVFSYQVNDAGYSPCFWYDRLNGFFIQNNMNMPEAGNVILGTTTGTVIGTATAQKLAFHAATPVIQRAGAAQAAVDTTAATNSSPYGFATAAQADALVTLVNELRAALVEKGLIKGSA